MSDKTVLVIDDSATIRKLVDTHLTPAGYRVILAPNAEDGLQFASEVNPDLILLDHQLPGTTGYQVCCQLVENPQLCKIPVVVSSTLRKKAYAEYIDLDNVVDMLPKPYTEELLLTTVANAIQTGVMVVSSQSGGSAVPEVIEQLDDAGLAGSFACFGLREIVDFLNNGRKAGVLEIEADRTRIRFHLDRGRIQGVYASGIDPNQIDRMVARLPQSLANLAPVFKMTIGGRSCAELDGFVQLLDQKVLDPRLMTKMLRFQAAMLVQFAFTNPLSAFRFEAGHSENSLHKNLPLDISLLALLVEAAMHDDDDDTHDRAPQNMVYVRRAIRGQNLDRAGLSARHMKVLNLLAEPKSADDLSQTLGWNPDEVRQVLTGFTLAELVESRTQNVAGSFVVFEPQADAAQSLRTSLEESDNRYTGKVVRDKLALQLVLKRTVPHTLVFAGDDQATCLLMKQLFATKNPKAAKIKRVALISADPHSQNIDWNESLGFTPDETLRRPATAELLFRVMDRIHDDSDTASSVLPNIPIPSEVQNAPVALTAGAEA
ncbi:Transcriptional regulatory protein AfsQ1 [Rubripirellula lacrimiformis]|uniref:Transcriptional regulatory protein AfsQ1 n=1 Tax=Rubripirellula lacrimiformis TaxID=1930273 RepID=A0A517NJ62_9BACT|nr:response regulator [Rubripirellula lacrimiformis]QDT07172.1 Transcriptional regulatory protein AfsQ1 [Rubripirellula lacrimiformis]